MGVFTAVDQIPLDQKQKYLRAVDVNVNEEWGRPDPVKPMWKLLETGSLSVFLGHNFSY